MHESGELNRLERRLESGDESTLAEVFEHFYPRLKRMVQLRMDHRLMARIDPSDVIQDAWLHAAPRIQQYLDERPMPIFVWIRFLVSERLLALHRHHLGTAKRDAAREISLFRKTIPEASSALLAAQLVGNLSTPSQLVAKAERISSIQSALDELAPADREIIALRTFERLSRTETADVLGIQPGAASKRYIRAMERLKQILECDGTGEQL